MVNKTLKNRESIDNAGRAATVLSDDVLDYSHTVNIRIADGDTTRTAPKADTLFSSIHAAG